MNYKYYLGGSDLKKGEVIFTIIKKLLKNTQERYEAVGRCIHELWNMKFMIHFITNNG
jgi:hypothetical protein